MRHTSGLLIALSLGASLFAFDPDQSKQLLLLAKIKRKAAQDLSRLPSFTCLASFERSGRTNSDRPLAHVDQVRAEIAYIDGHEQFAWPGSPNFETTSLSKIVGTGLASSGEFIAHARTVFVDDAGRLQYGGEEECAGRLAVRYDYRVSPIFSGFEISLPEGHAVIGIKGSFWADRESLDLLRLTVTGDDIPAHLGVRSVDVLIDYRRTRVGPGPPALMPQSAITTLAYISGKANQNQAEFTHCREYSTTSTLSFDTPASEVQRDSRPPQAVSEMIIPTGLICATRLLTRIDSSKTSVGDPISAVVDGDVRKKGAVVIPSGAVLNGRVRILQKDGPDRYLVGLEFTDITFSGKHARFVADIEHIDPAGGVLMLESNKTATSPPIRKAPDGSVGAVEIATRETTLPPQLPGVATFFVLKKNHFELAPGLRMEWWITSVRTRRK